MTGRATWQARRWQAASVVGDVTAGYEIRLDGRPLRLAEGQGLTLPTRGLADAVRDEWQRAGAETGGRFGPAEIGLTRLAATMIHRVAPARAAMIGQLVAWGGGDALRYRAPEATLAAQQAAQWDPLLDWLHRRFGLRLGHVVGIQPIAPPPGETDRWRDILAEQPDAVLTALGTLVPALSSLVLALAVTEGRLDSAGAVALSRLEERHQAARWGTDPAAAARESSLLAEVEEARRFAILARRPDRDAAAGGSGEFGSKAD